MYLRTPRRAQLLVTDFKTDITNRFPEGSKPGITAIQNRYHLHPPSGVLVLDPLRLALISKLQRLAPELLRCWCTTNTPSGNILTECMMELNGRARGWDRYDNHIVENRNRARRTADVVSGDAPDDSTSDDGEGEEDETEDEPMD